MESLTAVVFREEGLWVGQCLEHDICAQAKTRRALRERLALTVQAELAANAELGRPSLEGIDPAPLHFVTIEDRMTIPVPGPMTSLSTREFE